MLVNMFSTPICSLFLASIPSSEDANRKQGLVNEAFCVFLQPALGHQKKEFEGLGIRSAGAANHSILLCAHPRLLPDLGTPTGQK